MVDLNFGSTATSVVGFTDNYVYTDGISIPAGRIAANGQGPIQIIALRVYAAGEGATRSCAISLGSAVTSSFNIAASTQAQDTGFIGTNSWLVANGTTARITIDINGSSYFGRGGAGTSFDSYGTSFSGTLGGTMRYVQAPTAPASLSVATTATPGTVATTIGAPSDNGGAAVTSYTVRYANNVGMTGATSKVVGSSDTISGLTLGQNWYFDASANNAPTQAGGTTSVRTSVFTLFVPSPSFQGQISTAAYGVAVATNGTVYVADTLNNQIQYFDSAGNYIGKWGTAGTGNSQFNSPLGVAIDQATGNVYVVDSLNSRVQYFSSSGSYIGQWGSVGATNGLFATPSGVAITGSIVYVSDSGNDRVQYFNLTGTYSGQWGASGSGNSQFIYNFGIALDSTGNVYVVDRDNPRVQKFSSTGTYIGQFGSAGTDPGKMSAPLGIAVDSSGNIYVADANLRIDKFDSTLTYVRNFVEAHQPLGMAILGTSLYFTVSDSSLITDKLFVIRVNGPTLSDAINYYVDLVSTTLVVNYTASTNPGVILPAFKDNVWERLKDLCSAYGVEIAVVNGVLVVRDIGATVVTLNNVIENTARLQLSSAAAGLSVDFNNYNAVSGNSVVYDASVDGNYIQVSAAQTTQFTVKTTNYATTILTPQPTSTLPISSGTYYVVDSDGTPVPSTSWTAAGGQVRVVPNADDLGSYDITVIGPTADITGFTSPYNFSNTVTGGGRFATFSVLGSGVFTSPTTLNILAGTDPTKTSRQVAFSVDNFAHYSAAMVYSRCSWALAQASGPVITLTATLPVSMFQGFGLFAGSVFYFKDSKYRITEASINNETVDITATSYLTGAELTALWAGHNSADFDAFWSGYETEDLKIRPLRMETTYGLFPVVSDGLFPVVSTGLFPG